MNVLITGASNGIGYQVALGLASVNGGTVLAISRNEKMLKALASEAESAGRGLVVPLAMDLLEINPGELVHAVSEAGMEHIDILINNAGYLVNKPFENLDQADWQRVYGTNVFAPVRIMGALLPRMGGKTGTHVVNIGSYGGFQGSSKFPGLSAYSSSKAALANLTECLAEEFRERNIMVNCLALGAVDTGMLQQAFPGFKAPLSPAKMAEFITWFAMEGSAFFNGKTLPVTLSAV